MKHIFLAIALVAGFWGQSFSQWGVFKSEEEWRVAMRASHEWNKLNNPNMPLSTWQNSTVYSERMANLMLNPVPGYFDAKNLVHLYPLLKLESLQMSAGGINSDKIEVLSKISTIKSFRWLYS